MMGTNSDGPQPQIRDVSCRLLLHVHWEDRSQLVVCEIEAAVGVDGAFASVSKKTRRC